MDSYEYWRLREEKQHALNIKNEKEYDKKIKEIYQNMMDEIQKEIDSFYAKYAKDENITMAEAKKIASKLDIEAYARKAKKCVKEKNFSKQANEEMKLYNLTMKVNRLELLKANIGLALTSGHDDLDKYMNELLENRVIEELERQAGILGPTIQNNAEMAHSIVNASFHNATYSDRIWMHQDLLKHDLDKLLATGLIQGKNPNELARGLRKRFNVKISDAQRLMRTELARVQIDAQMRQYRANDIDEFEYIACGLGDVCDTCLSLDGKIFKVKNMQAGENAPPMHPNCHCSTAPHMDDKEYQKWLNFIEKGGTTKEWNVLKRGNHQAGGISGAWNNSNDPLNLHRDQTAIKLYNQIVSRKKEYEVKAVAKNSNFSVDDVSKIYEHIFIRKHLFADGEIKKFDPDYYMAHSWLRIREGKDIQKHDITMLYHELAEENIMRDSLEISYESVHEEVQKTYNYQKELIEYLKDHDV